MPERTTPRRVVVKIGSSLLTVNGRGLYRERIEEWSRQIASVSARGVQLGVVSSGAIAEGMVRLGLTERPEKMDALQMAAAVGQIGLLACWEQSLSKHDISCGQVLLSREDLTQRHRYLNVHAVLTRMFDKAVVPVMNENDAVAIDEIRMGDNDTLAARVVNPLGADLLLILTDQKGIYERNPHVDPNAALIARAKADDPRLHIAASDQSGVMGRGGARTKIAAAKLAARSAASTVIVNGLEEGVIERVVAGEALGTLIEATQGTPDSARKRWLIGLERCGAVVLDDGAVAALAKQGNSLLAVGVHEVRGTFQRGDLVACLDQAGNEIACGLSNYSSAEISRIKGRGSIDISDILGYSHGTEVIHRNNLVVSTLFADRPMRPDSEFVQHHNRGFAKHKLGELGELGELEVAIEHYNRALESDRQSADTYYNRGLAKYQLENLKEAIKDYDKAIELNPLFVDAYYNRGLAKHLLGNARDLKTPNREMIQEAIPDYDQAIALEPDLAGAYCNRGVANRELGYSKGTIQDYDKAIALNPKFAGTYYNRGFANHQSGNSEDKSEDKKEKFKDAIQDYDKAIELDPNPQAIEYYHRGLAKHRLGDTEDAIKDYDNALALESSFPDARHNRDIATKDTVTDLADIRRNYKLAAAKPPRSA